jgi:polyisoprenoid-binding protein YceI
VPLALLLLALGGGAARGEPVAASALHYELPSDSSTVRAHTGSSGLLGFAGHEHTIAVRRFSGLAAVDSTDVSRLGVRITVWASSLAVVDPGEGEDKRVRIEKDMHEKVLAVGEFATIEFTAVRFAPEKPAGALGSHRGQLTVALTLHGVTREISFPIAVDIDRQRLHACGAFSIKHSDFNLTRIKVAGVVNVAETIDIEFDIVGRRAIGTREEH